jgi:hypothetical protein
MDLTDENDAPLKLTQSEWIQHIRGKDGATRWVPETESDPYFNNMDMIFKSSGKIRRLRTLLEEYKDHKDAEARLSRHIFTSFFFPVAYCIYLVS